MTSLNLLLAALPILTLIGLLAFRVAPLPAVLVTLAVTVILSFRFPLGISELSELGTRFGGVTVTLALIMLGGIILSEMLRASGAQELISLWLNSAAHTRERAILLLGFAVTPFVESIIGWGVGIIVGVPLLMRAGLDTTRAATVSLLGLTLCPWGSLGPGLLLIQSMSELPMHELGFWIGICNLPVLIVMGVTITLVGVERGRRRRTFIELAITIAVMWPVLLATNLWLAPALAGVFTAGAGVLALLALARFTGPLPRMSRATLRSFSPYAVLVGAMLAVIGLSNVLDLGAFEALLTNPGLWLVVTALVAPLLVRLSRSEILPVLRRGLRTFATVCFVTVLFVLFGGLLSVNGMGDTLAAGAASLGFGFLLVMPAVGTLAGYLTGSNTSAGALLALGTTHATTAIGANPLLALGAQTAGVGAAVMSSPARVALAVSLANSMRTVEEPAADLRRAAGITILANLGVVALLTPVVALLA